MVIRDGQSGTCRKNCCDYELFLAKIESPLCSDEVCKVPGCKTLSIGTVLTIDAFI